MGHQHCGWASPGTQRCLNFQGTVKEKIGDRLCLQSMPLVTMFRGTLKQAMFPERSSRSTPPILTTKATPAEHPLTNHSTKSKVTKQIILPRIKAARCARFPGQDESHDNFYDRAFEPGSH